ncbi:MAG: L,D-transpeptidase [Vicinamibacterales bacterium]
MTPRPFAILAVLLIAGGDLRAGSAVGYQVEESRGGAKALVARYDAGQLAVLQALNRVDVEHLARLGRIVRPDTWVDDPLAYSPFPERYPWGEPLAKLIVVDQPSQVFAAYEQGRLVRWGPISSGRKESPTPIGLFHLNWRSEGRHSTVDPQWFMRWYFNFGNADGLSFHEYALPGRPASHSCVRLLAADARWLYGWGEEWRLDSTGSHVLSPGTPVLILGRYDFAAPPPWRTAEGAARPVELPSDPLESQHHKETRQ